MEDMPRHRPRYLHRDRTRYGTYYWYYRRPGQKRIAIPGEYGSEEFRAAYEAAAAGKAPVKGKHPPHTLAWLVDMWKQSSDWARLAPATRRQRENILLVMLGKSGGVSYAEITAADIREGREKRKATPFAANSFIKTVRALFRWAKDAEMIEVNPAESITQLSRETDGFMPWTMEDVDAYRKRWSLGERERVWLECLLSTGLRRGDAVRLGRQHVKDGIATLKAEKTGEEVYAPISAELEAAVGAGGAGDLTFIVGKGGGNLTKESFGNFFRDACNAAGVRKSAHGLRKLAATLLAERGGTELELQAVFGWRTNEQSQVYTKKANRKLMAKEAAMKMASERKEAKSSEPISELETRSDKTGKKPSKIKGG